MEERFKRMNFTDQLNKNFDNEVKALRYFFIFVAVVASALIFAL